MTHEIILFFIGLSMGFTVGWIAYSKWGAKVMAAEAVIKKG
jgi:hypothetical protein